MSAVAKRKRPRPWYSACMGGRWTQVRQLCEAVGPSV